MSKQGKRKDPSAWAAALDERLERYIPSQVYSDYSARNAGRDANKTSGSSQDILSRLIDRIRTI